MLAIELASVIKDMGGLMVPLAPVVVVVRGDDGQITSLTKLTGDVREMQIDGRWVLALTGEPVKTKVELDLD